MSNIQKELHALIDKKLVRKKDYVAENLYVYKYNNRVFFDNLWHKSKYLLKARGLVLDGQGNIVQHPFDKIFNFNENGTGNNIPLTQKVIAVEKANGFLGCVSRHPFKKGELLVSTTGSLDSDFVGYIHDLITPELKQKFLTYFEKNAKTLMFEAIHPEDPHVIPYNKEDQVLWLIGARGFEEDAPLAPEEELDSIATEIGLRRPRYFVEEFGAVLKRLKTEQIEGYVVRDAQTQEPILKGKTDYYLTTKFIGRMGKNNIELMYKKPQFFKEKIEEEFYELVDELVARVPQQELLAMANIDKIAFVRTIISDLNQQRVASPEGFEIKLKP